jgi:hypothetical protein
MRRFRPDSARKVGLGPTRASGGGTREAICLGPSPGARAGEVEEEMDARARAVVSSPDCDHECDQGLAGCREIWPPTRQCRLLVRRVRHSVRLVSRLRASTAAKPKETESAVVLTPRAKG